ncbi:MAG: DEAD/DEAH box helicase [Pseudomonadota bacterium]|nr:DEAD/DEAH box helicase [Pseudomonadota bacterium]
MDLCKLTNKLTKASTPCLVIVENQVIANNLLKSLKTLQSNDIHQTIVLLPDRGTLPYEKSFTNEVVSAERFNVLFELTKSPADIVITTVASTSYVVPPMSVIKLSSTKLFVNQNISLNLLSKLFSDNGFQHCETVKHNGEFSIKGSLLEFKSKNMLFRIEWFDDTIENIWLFNHETNTFQSYNNEVTILPQHEMLLSHEQRELLKKYWLSNDENAKKYPEYKYIDSGLPIEGVEDLAPIVYNDVCTIFDFLPDNIIIYTPENSEAILDTFYEKTLLNFEQLIKKEGIIPPPPPDKIVVKWFKKSKVKQYLSQFDQFQFKSLHYENRLMELNIHKTPVIITCSTDERLERFKALALRCNVSFKQIENIFDIKEKNIYLLKGDFSWSYQFSNYLILPEYNLYKKENHKKKKKKLFEKIHLLPNDYVVHEDYGIGQYSGLVTINEQEFMQVIYKKQAKIFIAVDQFNLLSKYHIQENVTVDELGSKQWTKTAKKARELTYDYAAEILKVNAKRHILKTKKIPTPPEYDVFKSHFPYKETNDQEKAIIETLNDLNKDIPMDRLICGDVGFGKTEIAIRACFAAALNQKQVLFIAPTTLLASQHFQNIKSRFEAWPIVVRLLTSQTKNKLLLDEITTGKVDVIITTHVVLRTALQYHDLSLIIIDEEHRFGVKDKEFIKKAHPNIHFLSMSATPIPRSLNFALSSLRDISLISTPPRQRTDIITQVIKHDDNAILNAVERELQRGGQVYMIHNDVSSIEKVCRFWQDKSNYIVADFIHGKMSQLEQDEKMFAFSEHKVNLLVATTIIESGIDIPNANTMIVLRADKFGLAQLHQLRGRVGRSDRQAYAYFITPDPIFLKKNALSRLNAINALSSLGSGYQLAVHDLEIRGTGSILGEQQSGMVKGVGYELYLSMLKQACNDLNLTETETLQPIEYQTYFSLIIPQDYISDTNQRLSVYQSIAKANNDEIGEIESHLAIHYGAPPYSTISLLNSKKMTNELQLFGCSEIIIKRDYALLTFKNISEDNYLKICKIIQKNKNITMTSEAVIRLSFNDPYEPHQIINNLTKTFAI